MKTKVTIVTNDFSEATKEEMWEVYQHYYHYTKESFMKRIASHNYYSLYTSGGKIIGFTGLRINETQQLGKNVLLMYFGQTVIDKKFRGKSLIPITGAKLCIKYFHKFITGKAYFWADSLTYKAYLVFAKTLEEYYPSYQQKTPSFEKNLLDLIGNIYYKDNYCSATGTVKKGVKYVNDPSAHIRNKDKNDPDIHFYHKANPMHIQGHGLITLGPVTRKNIANIFTRYFSKYMQLSQFSFLPKNLSSFLVGKHSKTQHS